jgi:chromosome segregation ATPase
MKKKESFAKKAEFALAKIDQDKEVIDNLKNQFDRFKKDLNSELKTMKIELSELERYELLKNDIDKKIQNQKKEYEKRFRDIEKNILEEQNKYLELLKKIEIESEHLKHEEEEAFLLKDKENTLKEKLNNIISSIEGIKKDFIKHEDHIKESEKTINNLKRFSSDIEKEIFSKKIIIESLLKENKEYEKQVILKQEELLKNIRDKTKEINVKGNKSDEKIKEFFSKKNDIEKTLSDVNVQKEALEKDLILLIKKAKAFKVVKGSKDVEKQVKDIENHMIKTENKMEEYQLKMDHLKNIIGSEPHLVKKRWSFFDKIFNR